GASATVSTVKVSSPHIGRSLRLMPYNTHCRTTNTSSVRARYLRAASAFAGNRRSSGLGLEAKRGPIKCRNLPITGKRYADHAQDPIVGSAAAVPPRGRDI